MEKIIHYINLQGNYARSLCDKISAKTFVIYYLYKENIKTHLMHIKIWLET